MFWLRFYVKNATKTGPIAALFYENAAIDLRQSVVQTKGGDLWLRFRKKRSQNMAYSCVFYENAAIDLTQSVVQTKGGDL